MPPTADAEQAHAQSRAPEYGRAAGAKVSTDAHPVTETATEARQGVTGHGVRFVLLISTAAVIVGFILVYAIFFGTR